MNKFGVYQKRQIQVSIFYEHLQSRLKQLLKTKVKADKVDLYYCPWLAEIIELVQRDFKDKKVLKLIVLDDVLINIFPKSQPDTSYIFLVPDDVTYLLKIVHILKKISTGLDKSDVHLLVVPGRNIFIREELIKTELINSIYVYDFFVDLIPLDNDLLSLELDNTYAQLNLNMNFQALHLVAQSIQRLQFVFGKIPHTFLLGTHAKSVNSILENIDNEENFKYNVEFPEINALILVDRKANLVTPFCSQFTYQGKLDEVFGILNNRLKINEKCYSNFEEEKSATGAKQDKLVVDLKASLYREIKNMHFSAVKDHLSQKVGALKKILQDKNKKKDFNEMNQTLTEARELTEQQPAIDMHSNIWEYLNTPKFHFDRKRTIDREANCLFGNDQKEMTSYVESLIYRQADFKKALRLYLLQNQVSHGFAQSEIDFFKKEFTFSYGPGVFITFNNLEKSGLLKLKDNTALGKFKTITKGKINFNDWETLSQGLNLVNFEMPLSDPEDAGFSYGGYCPISIRLIERALRPGGWKNLPGDVQRIIPEFVNCDKFNIDTKPPNRNKNVVLVYFIGGITLSEISALRFVGVMNNVEILIATTEIITGERLLDSMIQETAKMTDVDTNAAH